MSFEQEYTKIKEQSIHIDELYRMMDELTEDIFELRQFDPNDKLKSKIEEYDKIYTTFQQIVEKSKFNF